MAVVDDSTAFVKKFNELFINCIDLFASANKNPFVSIKLNELKKKTLKATEATQDYAILRMYKEMIQKANKITAKDEKYFLTEDCKSFVATMAMKYTEDFGQCMRMVGILRDNYKDMTPESKESLKNNIVNMLGCSAKYAQQLQRNKLQ
jgi:hypothetical protein